MDKFSIVLDISDLVSALKSKRGDSYKILTLIRSEKFAFHLSVPLVCEYESVLKRSELIPYW
jgi:predicted nucleic acid-binding protein